VVKDLTFKPSISTAWASFSFDTVPFSDAGHHYCAVIHSELMQKNIFVCLLVTYSKEKVRLQGFKGETRLFMTPIHINQ